MEDAPVEGPGVGEASGLEVPSTAGSAGAPPEAVASYLMVLLAAVERIPPFAIRTCRHPTSDPRKLELLLASVQAG